jgi:hypothetical protein
MEAYYELNSWDGDLEDITYSTFSKTVSYYFRKTYVIEQMASIRAWMYSDRKLKKELSSSYLKQEITQYMEDVFQQAKVDFEIAASAMPADAWEQRVLRLSTSYREAMRVMVAPIMRIYTLIMDIYMLARMFKVFKDGTSPLNIIVYGGARHVMNIDKFIQEYLNRDTVRINKHFTNTEHYIEV